MLPPSCLRLSRRLLLRLACAVGMVLVLGGSAALAAGIVHQAESDDNGPQLALRASGRMVVTNSRQGRAVLGASGLMPGARVSGTVTMRNKSGTAVRLRMRRTQTTQWAGPNGGRMGPLLRLQIVDVTKRKRPKVLYNGLLLTMKQRNLILKPHRARRFRFVVIFPAKTPACPDQNLVQGSTVRVKFVWTATPRR